MEWNVARTKRVCVCGRELAENEAYAAALYEQGEEFVRKDYCAPCWEKAKDAGGVFSFWKTTVPPKGQKRRLFAADEVLLDFFFRLENAEEEQKRHFFYLLGLILMRKKLLKFEDIERREGQELLCLRVPREDRVVRVPNPRLTDEQIEAVKGQLSEILDFQV